MVDWFRHTHWNEATAASFEARLARARRKAAYLNIQGYTLLRSDPRAAADLLRRAVALDEPEETARAGLYLGTALALTGDVDGAIDALRGAVAAEARFPMHRTAARLDFALLVALAQRAELYDAALAGLSDEQVLPFEDQLFPALIAQALIRGERGEAVASMAAAALDALDGEASSDDLPGYVSIDRLKARLRALCGIVSGAASRAP